MGDLGYLFAAFAIVWAVIFGYILVLSRRQRQLQWEIDFLKETTGNRHGKQVAEAKLNK